MEQQAARRMISSTFNSAFDRRRYEHFLRNLLNHFELRNKHYTGNLIPGSFKGHITQYWRVGKYVDPEGEELDLLIVEVSSFAKLERARSSLRGFAVNRLKQFGKRASLVAFYAKDDGGKDWRFSFVKIEDESYRDEKGKVKFKQELTPAKRYSYLVGVHETSHTAAKQLLPILAMDYADPRIEEIENAFSVEKVSNEFFEQYKQLFLTLAAHLKKQPLFQHDSEEETDRAVSRFAKKLLGQIVFLYFLQKKGWLGVPRDGKWGEGSKRFMRERFERVVEERGNYFRDFLRYLFYEALARERKGANPGYYPRLDCKIPFLNGGLFEAEYDWKNEPIDLPNDIFHNDEKNRAGDKGTGILDVFDRYNFTIKEDEPLEKEVAIDPEMLGKVFENMLEVTERKSKGAFYTPREIVHYICQEGLIHYLDNQLNTYAVDSSSSEDLLLRTTETNIRVSREHLDTLVRKGHLALENDRDALQAFERIERGEQKSTEKKVILPESVRKHAKEIDTALASIKVCDPAIGSGAFPVGMLHEIVNARLALAPHNGNTATPYELKRHAIRESIYGVDIDASAIDIARLRLWLSLIVDEERYDTIEPLPNLDYKIVRGDSLIGFPENWQSPSFQEIEDLKKQFFKESNQDSKKELKAKIDTEIQQRYSDSKRIFGYQVNFDFRLLFSEVWHQRDGFDVVIGNPPYVQIQKFSGQQIQKDWEKQKYETFAKTGDIYCLFYEKGYRILRNGGVLAFITSNKWMRAAYGKKLRKFFSEKTQPLALIDFSSFQVFETATVDTNVLIFRKQNRTGGVGACLIDKSFTRATPLEIFVEKHHIEMDELSGESWAICSKAEYEIKKRIEEVGTPLKDWDISINYGIKTGFNEAFIIDGKKKDELIAADPKSAEIIKPLLNGRDIKRYRISFHDSWLLFIPWHFPMHDNPAIKGASSKAERMFRQNYPAVYNHLLKYKDGLSKRNKSETSIRYEWYALQRCAASYYKEFKKKKIVWGNLALNAQFAMAAPDTFLNAPSNMITGGDGFLLATLNSSVGDFYIRSLGVTRNGGYFEYKPMFVENLPVPKISDDKRTPLQILADYALLATGEDKKLESAFFEQLIDGLVYELYFPDEIRAAGKEILPHLGELEPLTDGMSETKKLAVIQRQFDRLYDPNHPVRNAIETLDSVEVVRTIRGALKR